MKKQFSKNSILKAEIKEKNQVKRARGNKMKLFIY
jgi:hypothetical protein